MKTDTLQFKKHTMRRVYRIWFLRRVVPILGAEIIVLSLLVTGAQSYLSFRTVMGNMLARATSGSYWVSMVSTTEWMAGPFVLGVLIVSWMVARDMFKASRSVKRNFFRVPGVS